MIRLTTYAIVRRAGKIQIQKNVVEGKGKSHKWLTICRELWKPECETTRSMESCWLFMAATSVSCQQSVWWRSGVTFGKASIRKERRANKLGPSSTPASSDNLQSIMTAASLVPSRTHTAFLWANSKLKLHGEGEWKMQLSTWDNTIMWHAGILTQLPDL